MMPSSARCNESNGPPTPSLCTAHSLEYVNLMVGERHVEVGWRATAGVDGNIRSSFDEHADSSVSGSTASASELSLQVAPTLPHEGYEDDDDESYDVKVMVVDKSPSCVQRRARHVIGGALLSCVAVFLVASLLASVMFSRPSRLNSLSSDNTFATLSSDMQSRLRTPPLVERAQRDLTMTEDRCHREFPLLFPQLGVVQAYWKRRGGITRQLVEANDNSTTGWGHSRLIIRDGQVYVRSFREGGETRNSALVQLFAQAIATWPSGEVQLPAIDMVISPGDRDIFPEEGGWGVTRNIGDPRAIGRFLAPDFGFVGWPEAGIPSWGEFIAESAQQERMYPWSRKGVRAYWRGFPNFYATRHDLLDRTEYKGHDERRTWADVRTTTFGKVVPGDGNVDLVPVSHHCRHRYLVHAEGNSYSGRSRYLFSCHAVTVAHRLEWTQHFHPALNADPTSADQNFVQLPGPFFDGLEETVQMLRLSDGIDDGLSKEQLLAKKPSIGKAINANSARAIADNAVRTMRNRYLTPAATMCYTRAALRHYAASMDQSTWEEGGPALLPGSGVAPGASVNRLMDNLHGDIEVGVWRLLGAPEWPHKKSMPAGGVKTSTSRR